MRKLFVFTAISLALILAGCSGNRKEMRAAHIHGESLREMQNRQAYERHVQRAWYDYKQCAGKNLIEESGAKKDCDHLLPKY